MIFGGETGVFFDMATYSHSFADYPGQTERRIIIPLKAMGRLSDEDREVTAELFVYDDEDPELQNTANPDLYDILKGVIPAGSETGTFEIDLRYGAELDTEIQRFFVRIVPNDDFPDVSFSARTLKVEFSAQEMMPINWQRGYLSIFLGTYSTAYWKFIKQVTGMSIIPFWYSDSTNPDPETFYWNGAEQANVSEIVTLLTRALREYNQAHPGAPLTHDDGTKKGQEVVIGS
jgi:hypothetical protein